MAYAENKYDADIIAVTEKLLERVIDYLYVKLYVINYQAFRL